jgi:hypothetical protein
MKVIKLLHKICSSHDPPSIIIRYPRHMQIFKRRDRIWRFLGCVFDSCHIHFIHCRRFRVECGGFLGEMSQEQPGTTGRQLSAKAIELTLPI